MLETVFRSVRSIRYQTNLCCSLSCLLVPRRFPIKSIANHVLCRRFPQSPALLFDQRTSTAVLLPHSAIQTTPERAGCDSAFAQAAIHPLAFQTVHPGL